MNRVPKISVIIPVYQAEKYISSCVESILRQTYDDFEIILIDDGSTDSSFETCKRYSENNTIVKVFRKENGGPSAARNYGIEKSTGKYITFIDSDDTIDKDYLFDLVAIAEESDCHLAVSGIKFDIYDGDKLSDNILHCGNSNTFHPSEYLEAMLKEIIPFPCYAGPWAKLYLSDIIKENDISFCTGLRYGEDEVFNLKYISALSAEDNIYFLGKAGYHYRQINSDSLCSSYHTDYYEMVSYVRDELCRTFNKLGCSNTSEKYLERKYFYSIVGCLFHELEHQNKSSRKKFNTTVKKCCNNTFIKNMDQSCLNNRKSKILLYLLKRKMYRIIRTVTEIQFKKLKKGS